MDNKMVYINWTSTIGVFLNAATTNITGSMELTMLMIIIGIIAFAIAFKIPIEIAIPFILPFLIVGAIGFNIIALVLTIAIFIIAGILAKIFLF